MLRMFLIDFIMVFNLFIIVYVLSINLINIVQMILAMLNTSMYMRQTKFHEMGRYQKTDNVLPISVLVPAYNESESIVTSIRSLMALSYSNFEIIIVNDGSTDDTLEKTAKAFEMTRISYPIRDGLETKPIKAVYYSQKYPQLLMIDKENGGKADSLNVGINHARYDYFVSIDADSLLSPDSLTSIGFAFMEDNRTVAVGGMVRIVNSCLVEKGKVTDIRLPKSMVAMFQQVEYIRAFLMGRMGLSFLNSLLIISGAFGGFRKKEVIEVGGYSADTIGEDMYLVMKLHHYLRKNDIKYKISFLPDPVCWTQAPERVKDLHSQRRRWQVGLFDCMKRNKRMFLNPKYGVVGMFGMPYYVFFELLGPVIETIGLILIPVSYALGLLSLDAFVLFFFATVLFGIILSIGSMVIEEYAFDNYPSIKDFCRLFIYAIIENLGYRQLTSFFRLDGVIRFKKFKHSWSKIKRESMETESSDVA